MDDLTSAPPVAPELRSAAVQRTEPMKRKKPNLSTLVAARVNAGRRRPSHEVSQAPFLRLSDEHAECASIDAPPAQPTSTTPAHIHDLLGKVQRVIRAAEISECRNVSELRLLQECIDA